MTQHISQSQDWPLLSICVRRLASFLPLFCSCHRSFPSPLSLFLLSVGQRDKMQAKDLLTSCRYSQEQGHIEDPPLFVFAAADLHQYHIDRA